MTTIVCLGDSVTQGLGGNGVLHAESDRWPSVLAQATGAAVYNRGIGGEAHAASAGKLRTAGTADCRSCHDARHHPTFRRELAWPKILHGREPAK